MTSAGSHVRLLVGLGNPGAQYEGTRHNAGADFVHAIARHAGSVLGADSKFFGLTARATFAGHDLRLLVPTTYMNRSGQAVAALAGFYRIDTAQILVAHDELDLPAGCARLKFGGGHGGHNGLRDIIPALGRNPDFHRLRIGIGHPGSADRVTPWVLGRPSVAQREAMDAAIEAAIEALPLLLAGDTARAMNQLHSFRGE